MLIQGITPLDPAGAGRASFMALVESRGEIRGTIVRSQPSGRVIVSTSVGRFSLVLPESGTAGQSVRFTIVEGQLQAELGPAAVRAPGTTGPGGASRLNLEQLLSSLKLPQTESAQVVARAFARANLPLDGTALRAVLELFGGTVRPDQEQALALLLAKGAPINPALLDQMAAAKPETLTRLLEQLALVRDRLVELAPGTEAQSQLRAVLNRLVGTSISLGADSSITADHLERYFANSGYDLERMLSHLLGRGTAPNNLLTLASQNLKSDLLLFQQILGTLMARPESQSSGGLLRELQAAVGQALAGFEASQLAMTPTPQREQAFPLFLFLPIVVDEENKTLLLMVEHEDGQGQPGGGKRTRVTLQVEMTALGPVRAQLTLESKRLTVGFQVEDEETRELVAVHATDLAERLEAAGYQVDAVRAQVEKSLPFPDALFPYGGGFRAGEDPQGLDIKA